MTRFLAVLAFALLLPGCSILTAANTPVSTADAAKAILALQTAHEAELIIANAYVRQPPCGQALSPPAPLCASYAVAVQWQKADAAFTAAIGSAENALNTLGSNTTVVQAAITTATNAMAALTQISTLYGASK